MSKEQLNVIKVGGQIVEDPASLQGLLESFRSLDGKKLLVHGGGRRATKIAADLGIETQMVGGRRITDGPMLDVVTMVYGGLVGKNIVAKLQAMGVNAISLSGADMNCIKSHKRPVKEIDYGFVGDVEEVSAAALDHLISAGIVPVMCSITHDCKGQLLNTNADTIASEVAKSLASLYDVTLTFCFEKKGVLKDAEDEDSVIPRIDEKDFARLVEDGTVSGGMLPKLQNALEAVKAGVSKVVITKADAIGKDSGTVIEL